MLEDAYLVKLFAVARLVWFMRELKLVVADRVRPEWLGVASAGFG